MTKNELKRYIPLTQEINLMSEEIDRLRESVMSPAARPLSLAPSSGSGTDKMAGVVARISELEEKYTAKALMLLDERDRIESAINSVPDSTERTLLRHRYIDGMKWESICVVMGYEWAQTHRIHASALRSISDHDTQ